MGKKRILRALACLCVHLFAVATALAQERTLTGTITDETGQPVSGATIAAKGQPALNALSKMDGSFSINVPANIRALTVSHVGMSTQTVAIAGKTSFIITMEMSPNSMEEVVVVGYGQSKRGDLTVSQTTVSSKQIEKTVNTTLEQALQGRAAGVYVTQNTGQPGGGISVNIRGISSLGRTQPLYVVDGIQIQASEDVSFGNQSSTNPLANINPSDIEDIQILQGPSATAIYGSRATNGVILITTKRGKAGGVKINYGYQYNLQKPPKKLDVMNLPQYAQMVKEYHVLAGGTTPDEFLDPSILGPGTDWQKELFNDAPMQKHQLSFSGGNNNTTYYASGEFLDQKGVALGSRFKRYGVRINMDNKPREWITLGLNLNLSQTNEVLTTTNNGAESPLIANALRLTPQIPVTNFDGTWGGSDPVNGANQFAPVNPIALASLITNNNLRRNATGGVNIAVTPLKGLTLRTSFNGNFGNGVSTYYNPTYRISQWHYNLNASLTNGTFSNWYYNWHQLAQYDRKIGKHQFSVMVSHEAQESNWKVITAGRTGFLTNDILDVNAGDPNSATNSGGTYIFAMESYLGRATYNYDNRYLLTASYRTDGSAYFGEGNKWAKFPSVSVAWRVTNEKFWDIDAISELKLRFETGITGNQGSEAAIYSRMATGATPWGTGFLVDGLSNPLLAKWEETSTNNYGFNIGLLNNRFNIEADYYERDITNLIMSASLPFYMGVGGVPGSVTPPIINAGNMTTKGWNITLTSTNINTAGFRWETNLNLSRFKSTVVALNDNRKFFARTSWWMNNWTQWAHIGYDPWLFRGYIADGLFTSVEDAENSPRPVDNNGNPRPVDPNNGLWVGDVKYRDVSGPEGKPDGKITVDDETFIGNPWPKLTAGLTNTFSYKGLELSVLFTSSFGNDIYNYIRAVNLNPNNVNLSRNFLIEAADYARLTTDGGGKVIIENSGTNVARIANNQIASDNNYARNSSRFVEDGTYVRLKNISLSYAVPQSILGHTKVIKDLRISFGAQNLITWTNYSGYDPEVGSYVGAGASGGRTGNQAIGIDFGRYPLSPMYNASISVNF